MEAPVRCPIGHVMGGLPKGNIGRAFNPRSLPRLKGVAVHLLAMRQTKQRQGSGKAGGD